MQTKAYEKAGAFFEKTFAGCETDSNLLRDKPKSEIETRRCEFLSCQLSEEIKADEIKQAVNKIGVSESALFLSAFAYTLAKFTGQDECVFCTANTGRHRTELKNTLGMLVRTMPLSIKLNEEITADEFLKDVQKNLYETMRHDCFSFRQSLIPTV